MKLNLKAVNALSSHFKYLIIHKKCVLNQIFGQKYYRAGMGKPQKNVPPQLALCYDFFSFCRHPKQKARKRYKVKEDLSCKG